MPNYRISFSSINILNTRSAHQDTVIASFSLKVSGQTYTSGAVNLGDHNNGQFGTGLVIWDVPISSGSTVKMAISVFNSGAGDTKEVADVGETLVSIGLDTVVPGSGTILNAVYGVFGGIAFANCDGPCITQVSVISTDAILANGYYTFSGEDHGSNSPAGCGSNSDYQYTITFEPYTSGIGGFNLVGSNERAFAYDYAGSGKLDHMALYEPGTGTMWILNNAAGAFTPVYHQGAPGNGIGGYDLKSTADLAFAFDYYGSGKLDHIVLISPWSRRYLYRTEQRRRVHSRLCPR